MGSLKEILIAGGPILAFLIVLSIYTVGVIFERITRYRNLFGGLSAFLGKIGQNAEKGNLNSVLSLCRVHDNPASAVIEKTLSRPGTLSERRESIYSETEYQLGRFQQGLGQLATIGSVAPFIGLLGTVIGVMKAFKSLSTAGGAGANVVAVGISEALICTAAGLFVAIPAIVAYNLFTQRLNKHGQEIAWTAEGLLERLAKAR